MKDKILKIVETEGPVLPATISKECRIDSLMAAAYLSELVSNKKIMLSHLKVGGSPVYYTENQKARLQDFKNNLNEKDQKAVDLLKKDKILRDSELTPLMRVAMRSVKDFAIPLKVNKKEIFWKWYLISNEEALKLIKFKLTAKTTKVAEKKQEKVEEKKEIKEIKPHELDKKQEEEQINAALKRQKEELEKIEKQKSEEMQKREKDLEKKEEELKEKIKEENEKLSEFKKKEKDLEDKEKKLIDKLKKEKDKLEEQLKQREEELRQKLIEEQNKAEEEIPIIEPRDEFLEKIKDFCEGKEIVIEESEVTKKNKEADLIILIPTPVGPIRYFCRAKDKKKCNDNDLSTAYLKGQSKVLPTLFLTTGDLTKKADEMVGNEFKQMVVKKIENGSADN